MLHTPAAQPEIKTWQWTGISSSVARRQTLMEVCFESVSLDNPLMMEKTAGLFSLASVQCFSEDELEILKCVCWATEKLRVCQRAGLWFRLSSRKREWWSYELKNNATVFIWEISEQSSWGSATPMAPCGSCWLWEGNQGSLESL